MIAAQSGLQIVDFAPGYAEAFKQLNIEWISRYFVLEAKDQQALYHPRAQIIDRGGVILMALINDEPVGTVALIPYDNNTLELAKMAVRPAQQGRGIGLALGEAALSRARQMEAKRLYLESNDKLAPALALYQKLGFRHLPQAREESPYARCNVFMELML